jgi:hypothetical protein
VLILINLVSLAEYLLEQLLHSDACFIKHGVYSALQCILAVRISAHKFFSAATALVTEHLCALYFALYSCVLFFLWFEQSSPEASSRKGIVHCCTGTARCLMDVTKQRSIMAPIT